LDLETANGHKLSRKKVPREDHELTKFIYFVINPPLALYHYVAGASRCFSLAGN
jgi:hypothetical protein